MVMLPLLMITLRYKSNPNLLILTKINTQSHQDNGNLTLCN